VTGVQTCALPIYNPNRICKILDTSYVAEGDI